MKHQLLAVDILTAFGFNRREALDEYMAAIREHPSRTAEFVVFIADGAGRLAHRLLRGEQVPAIFKSLERVLWLTPTKHLALRTK